MKQIFLLLLSLSLLGCPSHKDPVINDAGVDVTSDVLVCDDAAIETETVVTVDNWQVTLPIGWVEKKSESKDIVLQADNDKDQGMLALIKEPYERSFDAFSIETIRGLRGQGAEIVILSSMLLNDKEFVYVKSKEQGFIVHTWLTVHDEFGYSLNCGGAEDNFSELSEDCMAISSSFNIR